MRLDRYYCQSRLFRDLVLEDGSVGEAACRATIASHNFSCHEEVCEQCTSQCTYPVAKSVAGVLRCTVARGQLAFVHCKCELVVLSPCSSSRLTHHTAPCSQVCKRRTRASLRVPAMVQFAVKTTLRCASRTNRSYVSIFGRISGLAESNRKSIGSDVQSGAVRQQVRKAISLEITVNDETWCEISSDLVRNC